MTQGVIILIWKARTSISLDVTQDQPWSAFEWETEKPTDVMQKHAMALALKTLRGSPESWL